MGEYVVVIDEGTTSTRAIAFDRDCQQIAIAQKELTLRYPQDGWVEQDGSEIWSSSHDVTKDVIAQLGGADAVAAIGITNQRETTLVWDRSTGEPVAPAIVWQDRRTAGVCETLKQAGHEAAVQSKTGLLLDPYFSATKIAWILDHVDGARARAEAGELVFGTVDAWLIWKLTNGVVHATDVTNASRTLLYGLKLAAGDEGWDDEMLEVFNVPRTILPNVLKSSDDYGVTDTDLFGLSIPIFSVLGDQQSAVVGQGCLDSGEAKITFGTGAFLVANKGSAAPSSDNRLLGTIGYEMPGAEAYALEGSIFNAGTVVKWLRDDLGLIKSAADSEALAKSVETNAGVYIVPAFTGMGAPHWSADSRGIISGLTRAATSAHIVRAALEAVAYQTHDLLVAFAADGAEISALRVDGGMAENDWLLQFLADICNIEVFRPDYGEMTALGAAAAAAMKLGWITAEDWSNSPRSGTTFQPRMQQETREGLLTGWQDALKRALL